MKCYYEEPADHSDLDRGSYKHCVVELRGVEPLSESSKARPSPSAVCDLTFPPPCAHRQAHGFSSFILQTGRKA